MAVYLKPSGPIASRALLPGDPKRAMELANRVLVKPLMSNLSRGLWGYHGATPSGHELTVQATGIGAPSATIVLHELAGLGLIEAIRIGTCVALAGGPPLGTVVLATSALCRNGANGDEASADTGLMARLGPLLDRRTPKLVVAPMERYYDSTSRATRAAWTDAGATVADLCTAALFEAASELGVAIASVLVVAEDEDGQRLADDPLESGLQELGELAAAALLGDPGRTMPAPS